MTGNGSLPHRSEVPLFRNHSASPNDRRGVLLNRERLNRRPLMQLEHNGLAEGSRYAKLIREELLAHILAEQRLGTRT
jgi:hypothetical protein